MSTQLKVLVVGSKMPTQSASDGAKMTRPSLAVVAPANLNMLYDPPARPMMLRQLNTLVVGSKMPTQFW